jgi:hypothetical protein
MILSQDAVTNFDLLLQTAQLADISKMIIEPGVIRGIDDKKSVVIITDANIPDFNGKTIGLNRINVLNQRVNTMKKLENFSIDVQESGKNPAEVEMITLTAKKAKAQFRCASPEFIKQVPKAFNDTWKYTIPVTEEAVNLFQQGVSMMAAQTVKITSSGDSVSFEVADGNRDVFKNEFSEVVLDSEMNEISANFAYEYPAKVFMTLLKKAVVDGAAILTIGEKGICRLTVNSYPVMILPVLS